jgi:hypothetical protein
VRIRLTRKLANEIDGVDLSGHNVGDVIDLSSADAKLLVAEEWAVMERRVHKQSSTATLQATTLEPKIILSPHEERLAFYSCLRPSQTCSHARHAYHIFR